VIGLYVITDSTNSQVVNIAHAPSQIDGFSPGNGLTATWLDDSKVATVPPNWSSYTYAGDTWTEIPPTLDEAKAMQTAIIEQAYASTMGAGLTSSADGTSRTYLVNATTISDVGLARTITEATYPATGIEAELLDGTYVTLDFVQMQTLSNDLQNLYLPLRSKRIKLLGQIKAATTLAEVQAATW